MVLVCLWFVVCRICVGVVVVVFGCLLVCGGSLCLLVVGVFRFLVVG